MDQLRIKSYTPDAPSYAPRISNEQWEQHKSLLKHLHDNGYKRAGMLDILRKQGFTPSMGQLNAKMTAWGFKVYGTQLDSSDQGSDATPQALPFENADTDLDAADLLNSELDPRPAMRGSISSMTLYDPENQSNAAPTDHNFTLDEVIIMQGLTLATSYQPLAKPADFGFKLPSDTNGVDKSYCQSVVMVADFLHAVHCFDQAFDLYHHVFEYLVANHFARDTSLLRSLVQCALSATTDAQCAYMLSILRQAHAFCTEHLMLELSECFAYLTHDLSGGQTRRDTLFPSPQPGHLDAMALLIATDLRTDSTVYHKEWLQQQLMGCDQTCETLAHLSSWCQDTLSFYRLENQAISRQPSNTRNVLNELTAFEHDFQVLISALIIDYLNSPGPSMKKANVECKEKDCLFRWALSPGTSLIVMAHLLYEPLRLQSQHTTNTYLRSRAQLFANSRTTTALQELRAFANADSDDRCNAFVDVFVKHFSTTLTFRRYVSNAPRVWDRIAAAKRLATLHQNNPSGLLPHAGLPSARRSVLKTMAAPFGLDPSLTEGRPSIVSDSGSMGEFARFASQLGEASTGRGALTPSDAMSIDTRSSWSFNQVTGFSQVPLSGRASVSSRRGNFDEMDEYRRFIRDNNYSQQSFEPTYPDTPRQDHSTPHKEGP